MHQDFCILWKSSFWLFSAVCDIPDGFVEVLIVSDWFNDVGWHVISQEDLKFITLTKVCQDYCLLGKLNCCPFWLFLTFLTASLMSSLSLIGSISYPDMWEVQNTLNFSHYLEKSVSRLQPPLKIPLLPFWSVLAVLDVPDVSFEVFIVSDYFQKLPWHVISPEQLECLTFPWKKCIKTAVSLEN